MYGVPDPPGDLSHRGFSGQSERLISNRSCLLIAESSNRAGPRPYFRVQVAELINRPDQFSFRVAATRANEHRERIGDY